ncbi:MAG: ABC transporter permease [Myxococcales bacterium]|nr:ABC transporter permease [Myxococcales bacterium]
MSRPSLIKASLIKESTLLWRDRGALLSLFALPIVFMAVFGAIFKFGPSDAGRPRAKPSLVWSCDGAQPANLACGLLERILGAELTLVATPAAAAREAVASGKAPFALIVPDGFTGHNGMTAELVVGAEVDAAERAVMEFGVRKLFLRLAIGASAADELVAVTRLTSTAPAISSFQVTVPGNGVLFGFFLSLTLALSFVAERRSGTWRRLRAAPVSLGWLLTAKLAPYFVVGVLQFGFFFAIGIAVFGMKVAGSLWALLLMVLAIVACAVAFGFFIASLGGSEKQVGSLGSMGILVMALLGGCMVPRMVMPPLMQTVGLFVPHGWALDGLTSVIVHGGGVAEVAKPSLVLLAIATILATIAARRLQRL